MVFSFLEIVYFFQPTIGFPKLCRGKERLIPGVIANNRFHGFVQDAQIPQLEQAGLRFGLGQQAPGSFRATVFAQHFIK